MKKKFYLLSLLVCFGFGVACMTSCCGDDDEALAPTPTPAPAPEPEPEPTPQPTPSPAGPVAVFSLDVASLPEQNYDAQENCVVVPNGEKLDLKFNVDPEEYASQIVVTSEDENVVSVEGTTITGTGTGKTTIVAKIGETEIAIVVRVDQQSVPATPLTPAHLTPLTIEVAKDGSIVFTNRAVGIVSYCINGGKRMTIMAGKEVKIAVKAGQKVSFYGDNATYATSLLNYSHISCDVDFFVYGNIMSLISSTNFANVTKLSADYTFGKLFYGNAHLKSSPNMALVLPATILTAHCYSGMFQNCSSLTVAPTLPALNLVKTCYLKMFHGCSALKTFICMAKSGLEEEDCLPEGWQAENN